MRSLLILVTLASLLLVLLNALVVSPWSWRDAKYISVWILAQWMPLRNGLRASLLEQSWEYWERSYEKKNHSSPVVGKTIVPIPTINVQELLNEHVEISEWIEKQLGRDWRRRPLLFRNLWSLEQLRDPSRRLSVEGLLLENNLTIPYFTDARKTNALTPDAAATVGAIVYNMTQNRSHKIGSQLIVQKYPELVSEIAPSSILTPLLGDYFTPDRVRGFRSGLWQYLPPITTVPIFIAPTNIVQKDDHRQNAYTALHCEPIGNVAVQLSGSKRWTLIDPLYSWLLQPSTAPDGRAFFASWKNMDDIQVPLYSVITQPGDAIWVPTWFWHRVDYIPMEQEKDTISVSGSLFHFRPKDFILNNPLFSILMLPAIFLEMMGLKTQ